MTTQVLGWGIDLSNQSGVPSAACAARLFAAGCRRAILNTFAADTFAQQYDVLSRAGIDCDGYCYLDFPGGRYYTAGQDGAEQVAEALAHMGGRVVGRLQLDCEDEAALGRNVADNVGFIQTAVDACAGHVFSGYYSRRDWHVRATGDTHQFADLGLELWDATNDGTPDLGRADYGGWGVPYMEQYAFDQVVGADAQGQDGIVADLNVWGTLEPVIAQQAVSGPVDSHAALTLTVATIEAVGALAARGITGCRVVSAAHDATTATITIETPWPLPASLAFLEQ